MKTSNILLLSLLGVILLSITIILVSFSGGVCSSMAPESSVGKAEQLRNLPHFNKIEMESKFDVYYTQDTFQRVVVKTDSSLLNVAVTEVKDGKLYIHSNKRLRNRQHIDIILTTDSIVKIEANAGSTFKTTRRMKVHQLEGNCNAGSIVKIDGEFFNLNLDFNAGSIADVTGTCVNLNATANAGTILNLGSLMAEKGVISANAGSIVTVNVTKELSVDANAGSIVKSLGNPLMKGINIMGGAQFTK